MHPLCSLACLLFATALVPDSGAPDTLSETRPLTTPGDLAAEMVAGIDRYLMRELVASPAERQANGKLDASSIAAYEQGQQAARQRLARVLGIADKREVAGGAFEKVAPGTGGGAVLAASHFNAYEVSWPVFPGVQGEGILLKPKGEVRGAVIMIPDADHIPEEVAGIGKNTERYGSVAHRLAEQGLLVLIPALVNWQDTWSGNPRLRMTNQPHREFLYRMFYQLGRSLIGLETQKVLAAVDWLRDGERIAPIGLFGYGEGGRVALYAAALDPRIKATVVSGAFGPRERLWSEPIDRNLWQTLREFGDAEVAHLISPRTLVIEYCAGPVLSGPPKPRDGRSGAAPGSLLTPGWEDVRAEYKRACMNLPEKYPQPTLQRAPEDQAGSNELIRPLCLALTGIVPDSGKDESLPETWKADAEGRALKTAEARQKRQFEELVQFGQRLMREAELRRQEFFWEGLKTTNVDAFKDSTRDLRERFHKEVIGQLPPASVPMNPRSRVIHDTPRWKGYEVVLDVHPDVFAYGILLLPKDLQPGERRPVVVCQHGLEGRPQDIVDPKQKTKYYNSFGAQLAERGFIVYAPQNPYIGQDRFRVLQRKANPLGLSLFSFIVAQHQRTLEWLKTLPTVDPARIGFYGLSYGGKTAMRVPAILPDYCLSICSGDFNEWTWKNVSVDFRGSYLFTGEYEMVEFNLGNTFGYAEMAALIAPRPFMVERGHDDGVGIDEWVAYEYAKVRRLYSRLKIPDKTEIEFFAGGHEIHGAGTFAFLAKHLNWPRGAKAP